MNILKFKRRPHRYILPVMMISLLSGFFYLQAQKTLKATKFQRPIRGPYFGEKLPGLEPRIFARNIVSTDDHFENSCTFTPDGKEFYFTRNAALKSSGQCRIMVSKYRNGSWSMPEPASFSRGPVDFEPNITPGGSMLFYNRMRPQLKNFKKGLWVIKRVKGEWKSAVFFRPGMFLTATWSGKIYYSDYSNVKDFKIVYCTPTGDVNSRGIPAYSEPKPVEGEVNSPAFDAHSYVDPYERYIIFDSRRDKTKNYNEIYICFRTADGKWGKAYCLGDKLGSGMKMSASVSPDGKFLFYSYKKSIYWVSSKIIDRERWETP